MNVMKVNKPTNYFKLEHEVDELYERGMKIFWPFKHFPIHHQCHWHCWSILYLGLLISPRTCEKIWNSSDMIRYLLRRPGKMISKNPKRNSPDTVSFREFRKRYTLRLFKFKSIKTSDKYREYGMSPPFALIKQTYKHGFGSALI